MHTNPIRNFVLGFFPNIIRTRMNCGIATKLTFDVGPKNEQAQTEARAFEI